MNKANLAIFTLIIIIFVLVEVEAEKEPVWQWASPSPIRDVDMSDDSVNISASHGLKFSLWHNTSSMPYNNKTLDGGVSSTVFSSSGEYLITQHGTTLTLWDDGVREWEKDNFVSNLVEIDISSDSINITAVDEYNVYFLNRYSSSVIWSVNHGSTEMSTVAISPDGRFLAAGTIDGQVFVYRTSNSSDWWQHSSVFDEDITDIEFSGDSSHLIIGTFSGRVHIYPSDSNEAVLLYTETQEVTCVSADYSSDYFLFGTSEGKLVLLSIESGTKLWEKNLDGGVSGEVADCTFNGNGHYILAGADNSRLLMLVNTTNGNVLWETSASGKITSVAMSYRGQNIIIGTEDGVELYYESLLDNQAPICTIESITPLISLPGTPITMNGSAEDIDGSVMDYLWYSSLDGNLSFEKNFTTSNLTQGLHTIFFSARDFEGKRSSPVTMIIGVGDFPEASIISVTGCDFIADCIISEGTEITFTGSASSTATEETAIVGYQWLSSLDNSSVLSTQSNFSISSLSRGLHTITFRAINEIDFWSPNVTVSILINGIPQSSILTATPNPVIPGEEVTLVAQASDPEGLPLNYIWTSDTLLFPNGQNIYENQDPPLNVSKILTSESDVGAHLVYLRVQDSHGIYSDSSMITINILSPPIVMAQCDDAGIVGEKLLFSTIASDKDGAIFLYEWDFDSKNGDIDSVDFQGSAFTTHIYNETTPELEYLVVVRVTDNDGLVSRDTCQVLIEESNTGESSTTSDSSGNSLGSISEIASPPILLGIGLVFLFTVGIVVYMRRRDDDQYISSAPVNKAATGSDFMSSVVPELSPIKERRIKERNVITETTVVECPECSAQIDVPNISGAQELQCPDCGLEGEIEL